MTDPAITADEGAPSADPGRGLSWRHHDHTQGRLLTSLFILAAPLFATSVTQAVFQLVDLGFVSRLGDEAVTAVVVTNQSIRQVFFMLTMGASFGAQAMVARAIGMGNVDFAEHATGQVLVIGTVLSFVVLLVGLNPEPLLRVMNVAPSVLELGVPYLRISMVLGFGFVFSMLVGGILNGAGDTTTPMWIAIIQAACALLAEWVLIFGKFGVPPLGIAGVAWGMAIGQWVGLGLAARALAGGKLRIHIRRRHLLPDGLALRQLLAISWQPAVQMVGAFVVNVYFLRLVGTLESHGQAAFSVVLRLAMVGPMLAFPLAGACATLIGQNLGSGNVPRAWRALRVGLGVHCAVLWTTAALLVLFRHQIVSTFATDPAIIELATRLLPWQAGAFVFWGFYFVFLRSLQGAGDVWVPMWISLANSVAVSLPLGAWFASDWGLGWGTEGVVAAQLVSSAVVTLATGAWVATGRWTRRDPTHIGPR